jgi:succinoglycan biosynthesis transport protein ExoP
MDDRRPLRTLLDSPKGINDRTRLSGPGRHVDAPSASLPEKPATGLTSEYFDIIRRHKRKFVLIVLLCFIVSLLFTVLQKSIYRAQASIEIQPVNENFLNLGHISPTSSAATEGGAYSALYDFQTQVKLLQSDSVLERVIAKVSLEKRLSLQKRHGPFSALRRVIDVPALRPFSLREEALGIVKSNLTVRTDASTRIIDIFYDSADPQLAADFVNALASEFIQQNIESRWKATEETGEWLNRQIEDIRKKLEKSETELETYARTSGLLFTTEKVGSQLLEDNVDEEKLRQLQAELSDAHASRVSKQSIYESAYKAPVESLPQVLDDKTLGEYAVKLTDLRRQYAELSSWMTSANPAVSKVKAQVNTLEAALKQQQADDMQRVRNEYDAAVRRETLLNASYALQAHLVSDQSAQVAHYNIIKSDVENNRQLYDSMLRSAQEAAMTSALRVSNIRVVDSARPPTHPYKPSFLLNSSLGLFAGAFLGFGFLVMRERADHSIRVPGETPSYLGVPELGVIPFLVFEHGCSSTYQLERNKSEPLHLSNVASVPQIELITSQSSSSIIADSFRAAAVSILYSDESSKCAQVIAFTSSSVGEGKTTVASNLALALVETGSSVLLIDGDLRKGRLDRIFNVSNSWGLSDLLAGEPIPQASTNPYLQTSYPRLALLPVGSKASGIASLLHSPRARVFLNEMRIRFDTIIIDTPPMLHLPDARILGRLADEVILVVCAAQTTGDQTTIAARRLMEDGTYLLGTILNKWDPTTLSNSAYSIAYRRYQKTASGDSSC